MSQEDVLDRLRSLDPNVRFHDDDEPYEAQAVMHRVLARPHTRAGAACGYRAIPRVAAFAAAAVALVLVLPALAVGTSPFSLLGQQAGSSASGQRAARGEGRRGALRGRPEERGHAQAERHGRHGSSGLVAGRPTARSRPHREGRHERLRHVCPNGTHAKLIMKDASSPAWSDDGTRIFVQRDTCTAPGGCDSSDEDTITVYSGRSRRDRRPSGL